MPAGRPPKYPWTRWFDVVWAGKELELRRGEDFTTPIKTMRGAVHNEAKRRGLRVHTAAALGGRMLVVSRNLRRTYPWDRWLDGTRWVLTYGSDFDVTCEDMRTSARRAARQRGLRLRSSIRDDRIMIQALADSNALEPQTA